MLFSLLMVGCGEEAKKEAVQEEAPKEAPFAIKPGENFTVPDLNLSMIWVKPGTFMMGSPVSEGHEIQHQVRLTKGFYLGKYEVTQAQWEGVMGNNPSHFKGADRPVEQVSWNDAVDFCKKLTEMEKKAGRVPEGMSYQLPTEAQWEYACRAGTTTAFSWGNDINSTNANYNYIIRQTRDVGNYAANPWGFFDMHGNVWEWTADWYDATYPVGNPVIDAGGPASGVYRILRGGSWGNAGTNARSARRNSNSAGIPGLRNYGFGFRVGFQKQ